MARLPPKLLRQTVQQHVKDGHTDAVRAGIDGHRVMSGPIVTAHPFKCICLLPQLYQIGKKCLTPVKRRLSEAAAPQLVEYKPEIFPFHRVARLRAAVMAHYNSLFSLFHGLSTEEVHAFSLSLVTEILADNRFYLFPVITHVKMSGSPLPLLF